MRAFPLKRQNRDINVGECITRMIPQHLPLCEIVSIRNAINLTNTEMLVEQILFNLQIPIEQFLFKTISIDHWYAASDSVGMGVG